jgi:hypothetical protein
MVIKIVMRLMVSFSSDHLTSRSHSLVLLVLLLNRLNILVLLLYLLMNVTLVV